MRGREAEREVIAEARRGGGRARRDARTSARGGIAALCLVIAAGCGGGGGGSASPTPVATATPGPEGAPTPMPGASSISFSPAVIRLDNPTSRERATAGGPVTVAITAYDARGEVIAPSDDSPIHVALHGAPPGALSPTQVALTSGSTVTFEYDGSYLAHPIALTAWTADPAAPATARAAGASASGAASLGRTHLVPQNPVPCEHGDETSVLPLVCDAGTGAACAADAIAHGLHVEAAVGHEDAASALARFTIDTGSTGTIVPVSDLGPSAVGPGAPGVKTYDSSGYNFAGHYYMAPVSFRVAGGGIVTTPPILVLGIDSAYCTTGHEKCEQRPPQPTLRYLGVGFDRGSTSPTDQLTSPLDNAFLQLASADGSAMSPGYVLSTTEVTLGIASSAGFGLVGLGPSTAVSGDWTTPSGCFGFPDLAAPNQFCGTLLLDVGIPEMFLDLEKAQRPAGAVSPASCADPDVATHEACLVPERTTMQIVAGTPEAPAMSYAFQLATEPSGPAPTRAQWIDSPQTFVNVGRRPLVAFDYLFDARCGEVGFRPPGG